MAYVTKVVSPSGRESSGFISPTLAHAVEYATRTKGRARIYKVQSPKLTLVDAPSSESGTADAYAFYIPTGGLVVGGGPL